MQVDRVKTLLSTSFNAKDIREYPKAKPRNECLKLYFSFDSRIEAQAFYEFINDRSRYRSNGINTNLRAYLLQTEQTFVELAERFAANPVSQDPKEESKDSTIGSPQLETPVVQSSQNQQQTPGV